MPVQPLQPPQFSVVQPCPPSSAAVHCVVSIRRKIACEVGIKKVDPCCTDYLARLFRELRRENVVVQGTVRVGDAGTVIEMTVFDENGPVDLEFANTKEFLFGKPISGTLVRPAQLVTDGHDGKLKYVTVAEDFDQPGEWRVQARVEVPGVGIFTSETCKFFVEPNVDTLLC
jgi:hypothetical protein